MRSYIYALIFVVCVVLTGAHPALAASKTPPPSNTKISAEENTKIMKDAKIGQYYDLYKRRDEFLEANASFRMTLDDRRSDYAAPMVLARGKKFPTEFPEEASSPDIAPVPDSAPGLSEAGIRAFYAESAEIHHKPLDVYREWTKNHLHETFSYTQTMTIKLPEAPPLASSQTLTRDKMIEVLDENYNAMRGVTIKNDVVSIVMAPDGKSAEVKDKSIITGLSLPVADGKDLRGDGVGICDDKVIFTPDAGIQLLRSVCTLDVTLRASQDL